MSRLPLELWDEIIDHVQNDFDALRACSLTCKAWVPRARYNLFWTVHVGPNSYKGLMSVLTRTPNIGRLVRNLFVTAAGGRSSGEDPAVRFYNTLQELLAKMPNVVYLGLHALYMASIDWAKIGSCLPKVAVLDLHTVTIDDPTTIPALFAAFPKLCDVECEYIKSPRLSGSYRSSEGPTAASLTNLKIKQQYPGGDPFVQRLLEWLFAHKLHTKLRILEIDGLDEPSLKPFSDIVSDIGPNLRWLGIGFDKALSPFVDAAVLGSALERCTNLRTFELLPLTLSVAHPWVCALLERVHPAELRWVNIGLKTGGITPADYVNVDFAGLAQVLKGFPAFKRVAFRVAILDEKVGPPLKEHILRCMAPLDGSAGVRVQLVQAP